MLHADVTISGALGAREVGMPAWTDHRLHSPADLLTGGVGIGEDDEPPGGVRPSQASLDIDPEGVATSAQDVRLDGSVHRNRVRRALDDHQLGDHGEPRRAAGAGVDPRIGSGQSVVISGR